ncbi:MAG: CoA transferase [Pseudomonadota bacterium]
MTSDNSSGALQGVRVIDLTTILMGPLACRMLADHGADVIQVVPPSTQEAVVGDDEGIGGIALDIHRNKRSIKLDLKAEPDRRAMWDLIASADVLVTNMRAAALDRLGLSAEDVRTRYPKLIYCLANGYGQEGPYASRAAYDDAIQALSGFAALSEMIDGEPRYAPSVIADKVCSLFIVQAVMAALLNKQALDQGQTIVVPMFETMVAFNMVEHLRGAALIPPKGTPGYTRLLNRERRPYKSADGWIALLPYSAANWRDFFNIIGSPELSDDPRFSTHSTRMQNAEALYGVVATAAPTRTTQEWISICDEFSIPCNPVLGFGELLSDPHLEAVQLLQEQTHPTEGAYHSVRDPVEYDSLATGLRLHAPVPGEHTREVLQELNWQDDAIQSLNVFNNNHH